MWLYQHDLDVAVSVWITLCDPTMADLDVAVSVWVALCGFTSMTLM